MTGGASSPNTGLPASFAALTSPNPCPVPAFAEEQRRKCRAQDCGFGNPETLGENGGNMIRRPVVGRLEKPGSAGWAQKDCFSSVVGARCPPGIGPPLPPMQGRGALSCGMNEVRLTWWEKSPKGASHRDFLERPVRQDSELAETWHRERLFSCGPPSLWGSGRR